MALINERYSDPNNIELTNIINLMISTINNLSDANISSQASIDPAKIAFTNDPDSHGANHAINGSDPLPENSIGTSQVIERSITSSLIGVGAILAEHFAPGAIYGSLYIDSSVLSADDGVVIEAPTGYDVSKTIVLVLGFYIPDATTDRVRVPIKVRAEAGQAVECYCYGYTDGATNTRVAGTVYYKRIAFK